MLTVFQLPQGTPIFALHTSVGVGLEQYFCPIIIYPLLGATVVQKIGQRPVNFGDQICGNKSCSHMNWKGALFNCSERDLRDLSSVVNSGFYNCYVRRRLFGNDAIQGFPLLKWGESGSIDYAVQVENPENPSRDNRTYTFHISYGMDVFNTMSTTVCMQTTGRSGGTVIDASPSFYKWDCRIVDKSIYQRFTSWTGDDNPSESAWVCIGYLKSVYKTLDTPKECASFNFQQLEKEIRLRLPGVSDEMWGDLSQWAIEEAKAAQVNSLLFLKDAVEAPAVIKRLLELAKKDKKVKLASALYLSIHYGLQLTISDIKEYVRNIKSAARASSKHLICRCRSQAQEVGTTSCPGDSVYFPFTRKLNYTVHYNAVDHAVLEASKMLMDWDFLPDLGGVWDFIPFSFILDWWVPVQKNLDRLDMNTYVSTLDVYSVTRTIRDVVDLVDLRTMFGSTFTSLPGTVQCIRYLRYVKPTLDMPVLRFDKSGKWTHTAEATAILLSR